MPHSPEQKKAYRAKRRAEGKPIKSGKSGPSGHKKRDLLAPNSSERRMANFAAKQFVAWDFEGGNFPGELGTDHRITFAANSRGDELARPEGIPPDAHYLMLIPWLYENAAKYPDRAHVFFSASYDWSMILRGIPLDTLTKVYKQNGKFGVILAIGRHRYDIKLARRRMLTIRRVSVWNEGEKPLFEKYTANFVDCFGFYQQTFVAAVKGNLGEDYPDLGKIIAGKQTRATLAALDDETKDYCRAELRALVLLMEKLRDDLHEAGIPIKNFWGAGAVASTMLQIAGMREHLNPHEGANEPFWGNGRDFEIPESYTREGAAIFAFFGARIEMLNYGWHEGALHDYDVNSCYPHFLSTLPSFNPEAGEWRHRAGLSIADFASLSPYSMALTYFRGNPKARFYPFPHRNGNGGIFYPRITAGWHHHSEILAALNPKDKSLRAEFLEISEAWEWIPNTDARPWGDYIHGKFAERARLNALYGKNGPGKVLKLGLNSLYGKTAQRVGWEKAKDGTIKLPTYQDLFVAGYITAGARAALYTRASEKPDAIISFATDGLTSREKLSPKGIGPDLGEWDYTEYDAGLFVMAGVYTLYRNGAKAKHMARGYRPPMGPDEWRDTVRAKWAQGETKITLPQTVFFGLGLALARKEPIEKLGQWGEIPREIQLTCVGAKRVAYGRTTGADSRLLDTRTGKIPGMFELIFRLDYPGSGCSFPFSFPSRADWLDDDKVNAAQFEAAMAAGDVADMLGEELNLPPG